MESASMASLASYICDQISAVFSKPTDPYPAALDLLVAELSGAKDGKIFLYGVGREGLMLRAMCMRLTHLGLRSHFVLDVTAPPISSADLLLASAGPGGFATVEALCATARATGARVVVLTAQPSGPCARLATTVGYIPATTMADDGGEAPAEEGERPVMLMGSAYEGALFVLCEMVVYKLGQALGQSVDLIRSRHTNLE